MTERITIPEAEYQERIKKAAVLAGQRGLDVLVVNSNEADYANVRYFSQLLAAVRDGRRRHRPSGKAALMVGPESGKYAADRSMISEHLSVDGVSRVGRPRLPRGQGVEVHRRLPVDRRHRARS